MANKLILILMMIGIAVLTSGCTASLSDLNKLELQTLDGEKISMNELKGKRVFVNFWATWCKPCIQEMPTIAKAIEQLRDEDIVFLFPSNETVDLIKGFKERKSFNFEYVQVQNLEALNIQVLPTTLIYDADGKLVYKEAGMLDWSTGENIDIIIGKTN